MSLQTVLFNTLGGLGLFIYGMTIMSESLQRIAGERLKNILSMVSSNRIKAFLSGLGITAIIQSSSATTVMLVGFVNAGLMTLTQAIGVALGAKVGTTVTGQLLAFNIGDMALPAIALGCFLKVFASKRNTQEIGGMILGFGLLFYGMELMKAGVEPFHQSQLITSFFTKFDASTFSGIFLCVLVGAICTMIVQSSSVTVGITMALATQGLLTLPGAAALVLGDNIGTTITAELAALKTDLTARQTARANTLCSFFGACYMMILFPYYLDLVHYVTTTISDLGPAEMVVNGVKPNIGRYVANAHTIFNTINSLIFLIALPLLAKAAVRFTAPGKVKSKSNMFKTQYLDKTFLNTSPVALSQSKKEITRMAEISQNMANNVFQAFLSRKITDMGKYELEEEALDSLQKDIHKYLIQLYSSKNTPTERKVISTQLNMVDIIERLGDTTKNIADLIVYCIENNIVLSGDALKDYKEMSDTAIEFHNMVTNALKENRTDILPKAHELEHKLDLMKVNLRDGHLERLKEGKCSVEQGLVFADMVNYFERLGDYLLKLSKAWVDEVAAGI